ncbi:hypothetical protein [Paenibacillus periandrae]|uniref:hypothetical protein n=1 Tax=Paenibacillus periandrae TaxID=1761741 RepID=UPI001F098452|nr:hypothetical protein [Paenibacillus periandrae]
MSSSLFLVEGFKEEVTAISSDAGRSKPASAFPLRPNAVRKANPIVQKSDSWDAECVAHVLVDKLESLPDANPIDQIWVMGQLVTT